MSPPSLLHRTCVSNSLEKGWWMWRHPVFTHILPFSHKLIQCLEDRRRKRESHKPLLTKMGKSIGFFLSSCKCCFLWARWEWMMRPTLGSHGPLWDAAWPSSGPQAELCLLNLSYVFAPFMSAIPSRWCLCLIFITQTNLACADICRSHHYS